MTWTYDPTQLPVTGLADATNAQKKNFVRLLTGDIDTNRQLISDEGIYSLLATEPNVYFAAARACLLMSQSVIGSTVSEESVGETRIKLQTAADLKTLATDLRQRGSTHMQPSAGGVYTADRIATEQRTDLEKPYFKRDQHSYTNTDDDGYVS